MDHPALVVGPEIQPFGEYPIHQILHTRQPSMRSPTATGWKQAPELGQPMYALPGRTVKLGRSRIL